MTQTIYFELDDPGGARVRRVVALLRWRGLHVHALEPEPRWPRLGRVRLGVEALACDRHAGALERELSRLFALAQVDGVAAV
jgi:hypothetical protein